MKAILTYHSIDDSGSPISVSRAAFERHVAWMESDAVRVVPLSEIHRVPEGEDTVAVTFDDGFSNFADLAWPMLRDAGIPATVFVVTEQVAKDNRWGGRQEPGIPDLPLMDWDTIGRVGDEGAEIGAHSATHASLPTCDDVRLVSEVEGCQDALERRLGQRPTSYCYPYGDVDDRVAGAVRERFERACTVTLRPLRGSEDACLMPRLDAYYLQAPGRIERFGTSSFARWVGFRAVLRSVRHRVRVMTGR